MVTLKCHNCGSERETDSPPKEFVCRICGAVNVVPLTDGTYDEAAGCIPPTSFEWKLPAGCKETALGEKIFITAQGTEMSKKEYIDAFGLDPEIALGYMRAHKGVHKA